MSVLDEQHKIFIQNEIRSEVESKMLPLTQKVDKIDRRLLGLWSNGSGGPPGYLETARDEDKRRQDQLDEALKEIRSTQLQTARSVDLITDRDQQKAIRRKKYIGLLWKIGGPIGAALLSLLAWGWHEVAPVFKVLWEDYLKAHPAVSIRLQQMSQDDRTSVYAQEELSADPNNP